MELPCFYSDEDDIDLVLDDAENIFYIGLSNETKSSLENNTNNAENIDSQYEISNNIINGTNYTSQITPFIFSTDVLSPFDPVENKNAHKKTKKKPKNKKKPVKEEKKQISLTYNQKIFRNEYYSIFLNGIKGKTILRKDLVLKIHQHIYKELGIKPIKRSNRRCAYTYFQDFEPVSDKILDYIKKNKDFLSELINISQIKAKKT